MLKHILLLIVLSIIVIIGLHQLALFLHWIGYGHAWLAGKFNLLFSGISFGFLISRVLALIIIPLIVALIPAFIYWLIKRSEMPHLFLVVWIIWIMLITIIALH